MSLTDKVIIVTGGSSGIGAATSVVLAREGANVVVTGRNKANLNSVAEKCGQVGKQAFVIKADITKDDEAAAIIENTIKKFGKLDVLVNNGGILKAAHILDKNAIGIFDEVMNINVRAAVVLCNLAAPYLIKTKGSIVNISSIAGSAQVPRQAAYCTSKAALNHFSTIIARELAEHGVRVNIISPGPVQTPLFEKAGADISLEFLKSLTALKKVVQPEEIGELIVFIVGDKGKCITGSNYVIDCGALVNLM